MHRSTLSPWQNCYPEIWLTATFLFLNVKPLNRVSYLFPQCIPYFFVLQILSFLQFGGYTFVRNSKDLFHSFGFDSQPVIVGFIIFQVTFYFVAFSWKISAFISERWTMGKLSSIIRSIKKGVSMMGFIHFLPLVSHVLIVQGDRSSS